MDRSKEIKLISETHEQNDYGVTVTSRTSRTVFAQVDSVTRAEFHEAGRNGLNPEFRFTLFAYDYNGEQIIEFGGQTYTVYRSYFGRDDTVELYVERQGGSNGS